MKPIVLSEQNWAKLRYQIKLTHPKSVLMIRYKMREVLGFTNRQHTRWVDKPNKWGGMGYTESVIYLDFVDDAKRTFFLLKYGDWIR